MALDSKKLEKIMIDNIEEQMKKIDPDSEPREFQMEIAKAFSSSIVKLLKGPSMGIGAVATAWTGKKVKNINVNESVMTQVAFSDFKSKFPKATEYTELFFKAVNLSVKEHLEDAEVFSISGFGGPVLQILGFDPKGTVLFAMVKPLMPSKYVQGMAGIPFLKSLSAGISTGILAGKVREPLPETFAVPPAGPIGPTLVKFS